MAERRRTPRFKAPIHIKYSLPNYSEEEFSALSEDISLGGVKVLLNKAVGTPLHSLVKLNLLLPNQTLSVQGELLWVHDKDSTDKEAGIAFLNIPDSYKEEIFNYIFKYHKEEIMRSWWKDINPAPL